MEKAIIGDIPSPNPIDVKPILFVQAYIHKKPYFFAEEEPTSSKPDWFNSLDQLSKHLLAEFGLKLDNFMGIHTRSSDYSFVGYGEISYGFALQSSIDHLTNDSEPTHYIISPYEGQLPSIVHLNKILPSFDLPLIFAGPLYHTIEEEAFLNFEKLDEDMPGYPNNGLWGSDPDDLPF